MRRSRRTKVLATLGPSSSEPSTIEALFRAGADVFRINMSHTDHAGMRGLVAAIRSVEETVGRPIGILADLQGPKLRLGVFADGKIELEEGTVFRLDSDSSPGDHNRVELPHPEILEALQPGHRLLIDDGRVKLTVEEMTSNGVSARVDVGGTISDRKGVSVPDTTLALSAMTEKDRRDLDAVLEAKVDWVALSFIQRPDDLAEVRKIARGRVGVMAKIEKPQAIERLEDIIELSDALMVARGDLGVEMPVEKVPGLQKKITRAARKAGKPVVVATQMLESMINAPTPTRAEVSDVATAVFEGADAVMLSAESAAGKYPIEAVTTMDRIAYEVERDDHYMSIIAGQRSAPEATGADAIAAAARQIAETLNLSAIVCYTSSGATALRVARERPSAPLVVVSPVRATARRLALAWGLHCVISPDARDVDDMVDRACSVAFAEKFARPGQRLLTIAGSPFGTPGATNLLRVAYVSDDGRGGS